MTVRIPVVGSYTKLPSTPSDIIAAASRRPVTTIAFACALTNAAAVFG